MEEENLELEEERYSDNEYHLHSAIFMLILNDLPYISEERANTLSYADFRDDNKLINLIDNDTDSMCWLLEGCDSDIKEISKNIYNKYKKDFIRFAKSRRR
jgi:Mg2+ and Co2+ transporter CorA